MRALLLPSRCSPRPAASAAALTPQDSRLLPRAIGSVSAPTRAPRSQSYPHTRTTASPHVRLGAVVDAKPGAVMRLVQLVTRKALRLLARLRHKAAVAQGAQRLGAGGVLRRRQRRRLRGRL